MPFVEIHDVGRSTEDRQRAARAVTDAVVEAFAVEASTVDIHFHAHPTETYARSGVLPVPEHDRRTFIKIHAFARDIDRRRTLARLMTTAMAECFGAPAENIVIYFLDRSAEEVSHAGRLASERGGV